MPATSETELVSWAWILTKTLLLFYVATVHATLFARLQSRSWEYRDLCLSILSSGPSTSDYYKSSKNLGSTLPATVSESGHEAGDQPEVEIDAVQLECSHELSKTAENSSLPAKLDPGSSYRGSDYQRSFTRVGWMVLGRCTSLLLLALISVSLRGHTVGAGCRGALNTAITNSLVRMSVESFEMHTGRSFGGSDQLVGVWRTCKNKVYTALGIPPGRTNLEELKDGPGKEAVEEVAFIDGSAHEGTQDPKT